MYILLYYVLLLYEMRRVGAYSAIMVLKTAWCLLDYSISYIVYSNILPLCDMRRARACSATTVPKAAWYVPYYCYTRLYN